MEDDKMRERQIERGRQRKKRGGEPLPNLHLNLKDKIGQTSTCLSSRSSRERGEGRGQEEQTWGGRAKRQAGRLGRVAGYVSSREAGYGGSKTGQGGMRGRQQSRAWRQ